MKSTLILIVIIFLLGFLPPEHHVMPVKDANSRDWNPESFWYYPWGRSGVHKGIDIFAKKGTEVRATTHGVVLYSGNYGLGGKVVYILGANWRLHYYAHLDTHTIPFASRVRAGDKIGTVGTSGNAVGKPPHLHYTIKSLFPRFWTYNSKHYAPWQRTYFLDPGKFLQGVSQ